MCPETTIVRSSQLIYLNRHNDFLTHEFETQEVLVGCRVVYFLLSVTVQLIHLLYSTGYMRPECLIYGLGHSLFVHSMSCMNISWSVLCIQFTVHIHSARRKIAIGFENLCLFL